MRTRPRLVGWSGGTFAVSQSAQQIFDTPSGASVFAAVNWLRVALQANDQAGITAAVTALSAAHDPVERVTELLRIDSERSRQWNIAG